MGLRNSDERLLVLAVLGAAIFCGVGPILLGAAGLSAIGLARGGLQLALGSTLVVAAVWWTIRRRVVTSRRRL